MSFTISRRFTSNRLPQPNPPSTRESLSCPVEQWQRVNLVQYSLIGGVDPAKALSVTLDVGTDNDNLLNDHLYVVCLFIWALHRPYLISRASQGWPHTRVRGKEYDDFVDK